METEKITQPPEATGARDLSAEHRRGDDRHLRAQAVMEDLQSSDEQTGYAISMSMEKDGYHAAWGRAINLAREGHASELNLLTLGALAEMAQAMVDEQDEANGNGCHAYDAETMDERPSGELES